MESQSIPTYGKNDLDTCLKNFKFHIISNINNIPKIKSDLLYYAINCKLEREYIRAIAWKIFLNTLPIIDDNTSLKTWLEETLAKRKLVKKLIKNTSINKLKGDPLGGTGNSNEKNTWGRFFDESKTHGYIKNDVNRTKQGQKLFQEPYIQKMEKTILLIYFQNNENTTYKQGMTDILSTLIYALYPFYFKSPLDNNSNSNFDNWISEPDKYYKEIYYFFHDEDSFEYDLYYLFENIMNKTGLIKFFDDASENTNAYKPYLLNKSEKIICSKLRLQDKKLYLHFLNKKLDYFMVFQRWLKCLFNREFEIRDCIILWDSILANEFSHPSGELEYVDYVVISMLLLIRDDLIRRDSEDMLELLMHYPKTNSIHNFVESVEKIKSDLSKMVEIEEENEKRKKEIEINKQKQIDEMIKLNQEFLKQQQISNNMEINKNKLQVNSPIQNNNLNQNFISNNNSNLMFMQYNSPNLNMQSNNIFNDFEILDKKDLTPMEKLKSMYFVSNKSCVDALKQLKDIINNYKNKISVDDKNKIDILIDELSTKL